MADVVVEESVTEVNEPVAAEQVEVEPEPEMDDTATTEDDQKSGAKDSEEATVEKENDADETAEPAAEDVGTVTEKQAEDADASGKDAPAKADESA